MLFAKETQLLCYDTNTIYIYETATLFFCFPADYKSIRSTKPLAMSHPRYLQRFTTKLGMGSSGIDESYVNYFKQKITYLKPHERICSLLIDEVYVKPKLTFKAGLRSEANSNYNI